jgi:hypothetical protein
MPAIAGQHALERLLLVLHTKRRHSRVGKVHGAPAEGCLQFHERWLQIDALPGVANRECPGKEIEISLVQPEQLLVSQSRCDHDVTQRPKAIVAGVIDECPRLFRLKWLDLVANGARRFHKSRDVAVHLFPFLRLPERPPHGPGVLHGLRLSAGSAETLEDHVEAKPASVDSGLDLGQ